MENCVSMPDSERRDAIVIKGLRGEHSIRNHIKWLDKTYRTGEPLDLPVNESIQEWVLLLMKGKTTK